MHSYTDFGALTHHAPGKNLSRVVFSCGVLSLVLGFIMAIPCIILGHRAASMIHNNPKQCTGRKLVLTGLMFAYLAFGLSLFVTYYLYQSPETLQQLADLTGQSLTFGEELDG